MRPAAPGPSYAPGGGDDLLLVAYKMLWRIGREKEAAGRAGAGPPPDDPPDGHRKGAGPRKADPVSDVDLTSPDRGVLACPPPV